MEYFLNRKHFCCGSATTHQRSCLWSPSQNPGCRGPWAKSLPSGVFPLLMKTLPALLSSQACRQPPAPVTAGPSCCSPGTPGSKGCGRPPPSSGGSGDLCCCSSSRWWKQHCETQTVSLNSTKTITETTKNYCSDHHTTTVGSRKKTTELVLWV